MQSSFHLVDWVIVAVYLVAMALVGIYFSRQQTTLDQYLRAGRSMGWLPVGLSLIRLRLEVLPPPPLLPPLVLLFVWVAICLLLLG